MNRLHTNAETNKLSSHIRVIIYTDKSSLLYLLFVHAINWVYEKVNLFVWFLDLQIILTMNVTWNTSVHQTCVKELFNLKSDLYGRKYMKICTFFAVAQVLRCCKFFKYDFTNGFFNALQDVSRPFIGAHLAMKSINKKILKSTKTPRTINLITLLARALKTQQKFPFFSFEHELSPPLATERGDDKMKI